MKGAELKKSENTATNRLETEYRVYSVPLWTGQYICIARVEAE